MRSRTPVRPGWAVRLCRDRSAEGAGTGGGVREGLLGVPEDGGIPEPWSAADLFPDRTREYHWAPEQLPGGRGVLFTASGLPDRVGIAVRLLDTREQRMLIEDGAHPRYLPGGRLLFARGADLYVVPFDAHDMEVTGPAVLALEGVSRDGPDRARFDVSDNGTLVYVPSGPDADSASPASVDRPGPVAGVEGPAEFRVVTNWLRELAKQL